jgi:hypothetical protein
MGILGLAVGSAVGVIPTGNVTRINPCGWAPTL